MSQPKPMVTLSDMENPSLIDTEHYTRKLISAAAVLEENTPQTIDGYNRGLGFQFDISQDAHALALGPRCTFGELIITRSGEIKKSRITWGPITEIEPIVVSANRPWIGLLPAGRYTVYPRVVPRILGTAGGGSDWWATQMGPTWNTTSGDGETTPITVPEDEPTVLVPVCWFDLIAYHSPIYLQTLPQGRAKNRYTFRYKFDGDKYLGWDAAWPTGEDRNFIFHTEDRANWYLSARSGGGVGTAWNVSIYLIIFNDAGERTEQIQSFYGSFTVGNSLAATVTNGSFNRGVHGILLNVTKAGVDADEFDLVLEANDEP